VHIDKHSYLESILIMNGPNCLKKGSETNLSSKLYNYLCHSIDAAATVRQSRAKLSTAERAEAASTPTCRPPSTL
jgi:hypothetical protein